jgi:hypothetical protein
MKKTALKIDDKQYVRHTAKIGKIYTLITWNNNESRNINECGEIRTK